ncbi:hypothetical protein AAMO2058_000743800 [Amorphochlora amoebiformis]
MPIEVYFKSNRAKGVDIDSVPNITFLEIFSFYRTRHNLMTRRDIRFWYSQLALSKRTSIKPGLPVYYHCATIAHYPVQDQPPSCRTTARRSEGAVRGRPSVFETDQRLKHMLTLLQLSNQGAVASLESLHNHIFFTSASQSALIAMQNCLRDEVPLEVKGGSIDKHKERYKIEVQTIKNYAQDLQSTMNEIQNIVKNIPR